MKELRDLTRRFTEREIVPHLAGWERVGEVPRSLHLAAAKVGLLGVAFPAEVGGGGGTLLDSQAVVEEVILAGGSSGLVAALFTLGIAPTSSSRRHAPAGPDTRASRCSWSTPTPPASR